MEPAPMTTTTKIAGEAMTDEWRTAFDDRHEFDVYPEHFMSGLRNEFAAGWHAAMKSQARALLASKAAVQKVCALCGSSGDCKSDDARTLAECGGAWYRPTAPATAKEPIGWLVRGESTHLYFDASNKPGFVVINGNDPVVSIEPHYAAPTAPAQPCGEDAAEQVDSHEVDHGTHIEIVPHRGEPPVCRCCFGSGCDDCLRTVADLDAPSDCSGDPKSCHDKYEALEREHLGDADKRTGIYATPQPDAANGAMGEREASAHETLLQALGYPWLPCPICKGTEGCDHSVPERARAALTAEKVAGQEAVGEVTATVLEGADQGVIGWYGDPLPVNSLLYAAPPQPAQSTEPTDDEIEAMCAEHGLGPNVGKLVVKDALNRWRTAQSAEQDERAALDPRDVLSDTGNPEADRLIGRLTSADPDFNDCTDAAVFIRRLVVEHRGPDGFATWKDAAVDERQKRIALEARAASTQSTATQPVQAERALPVAGETWYAKIRDASTLSTFEVIEVSAGTVLVTSPGSHYQNRFEISDLKFIERLLAAQPASGGEA
jgi:hypothetical protein